MAKICEVFCEVMGMALLSPAVIFCRLVSLGVPLFARWARMARTS